MPIRNQRGAGIFEILLVCILISLLVGMVIPYYQRLAQKAREVTLQSGLIQIRKGVELYRVLQGHYPSDLKSLVHARYLIPIQEGTFFSGEYLNQQTMDAEGNLLDPFGNSYRYNNKDGTVSSSTKEYEKW